MFTPKCTRKGCDWVGTPKDTEGKMKQAVKMHIGRLHDKSIPTFKGHGHVHVHAKNGHGTGTVKLASVRGRRGIKLHTHAHNGTTHRKPARVPVAVAHAAPGTEVKVNFCNNCGASIEGQAQGIVIANLLKTNSRFRAKVEKLLAKV